MGPSSPDGGLTVAAPAKINLYLEVRGRRPDGFHEVVTVLQTIDLCDVLTVAPRARRPDVPRGRPDVDLALTTGDPAGSAPVPASDDNLAARAAAAVLRVADLCDVTGLSLRLLKRIPAGGGLGGGSSDAAAAAATANELLGSPCDAAALARLCADIGSDVPFFLTGGTALCTGRGEQVRPLEPPAPFEATLVLPGLGLSTADVYRALDAPPLDASRRAEDDSIHARGLRALETSLAGANVAELERSFRNDLEEPAGRVAPALAELLAEPRLHLSGSGSSLFSLGPEAPSVPPGLASGSIRIIRIRSKNR